MTDVSVGADKAAASEVKRIKEEYEFSQTVSDAVEREARRYPRIMNGGKNG